MARTLPSGSTRGLRAADVPSREAGRDDDSLPKSFRRAPAVPTALAFGAGIVADSQIACGLFGWLASAAAFLLLWLALFCSGRNRGSALALLAGLACLGAAWHHLHWSTLAPDDLSLFATERPQPVRLIGILENEPAIIPKREAVLQSAIPQYDRTRCLVRGVWLVENSRTIPVSGRAQLEVSGHLLHAHLGDEVEIFGHLSRPGGPRNPGAFDYREYLHGLGVHSLLRCDIPDAVRVRSRSSVTGWTSLRSRSQLACSELLTTHLDPRVAPLAVALLLGPRHGITAEDREFFIRSGTMHVLAISGMHVGILAAFLWTLCRIIGGGERTALLMIGAGLLTYLFVTDANPPVVRATVFVLLWLAGTLYGRESPGANSLAAAALIVLLWSPVDLFLPGPQLSFLAVMALQWSASAATKFQRAENDLALQINPSALQLFWSRAKGFLIQTYLLTAAVWLFTLPLIMARFHVISFVGFLINVMLMPWLTFTLWCGYALLMLGLLLPPVAAPLAWGLQQGLAGLLWLVEASAKLPWGHVMVSGPAEWWLIGYYALLAAAVWGGTQLLGGVSRAGIARRALLCWIVIGAAQGLGAAPSDRLRCTFLAVGHGVAILLELPGGQTILYDAGSLQDPERAQQIVQAALWEYGIPRIDSLILSHADIDHYNAVPGLLREVPIGAVYVAPSFLRFQQESVAALCEAIVSADVPLRLLGASDNLRGGANVTLRILHPEPLTRNRHDNANSVVLEVQYAGQRILLTGDLERDGLKRLLEMPPLDCAVLLSPHHGSTAANPPELAAWARPKWLIVSGGRDDSIARLQRNYGPSTTVYSTVRDGAVTCSISASGSVSCTPFRARSAD